MPSAGLVPVLGLAVAAVPASARAGVPRCPSVPARALDIAPAHADFAGQIEPSILQATRTGQGLRRMAQLDLQVGEWIELFDHCFAGANQIELVGDGRGEGVWALRGPGIASPQRIACLSDWHARRKKSIAPFAKRPGEVAGACVALYAHNDGAATMTMGRDFLLIATKQWAASVRESLSDESRRGGAVDLIEAQTLVRADSTTHFVGTRHRPDTLLDPGPWVQSVRNFAVEIDVDASGTLSVHGSLQTRDFGESVVLAVQTGLSSWSARAEALGLPKGMLQGLGLRSQGTLVELRWQASAKLLHEIGAALNRGGRGGGLF